MRHGEGSVLLQEHGPFLLVTLIGVRPALQCQGIGSRLLERVLRHADTHSLPSYLEVRFGSGFRPLQQRIRHGPWPCLICCVQLLARILCCMLL
jgi:GNAT superfamily N-acetyltransferase